MAKRSPRTLPEIADALEADWYGQTPPTPHTSRNRRDTQLERDLIRLVLLVDRGIRGMGVPDAS